MILNTFYIGKIFEQQRIKKKNERKREIEKRKMHKELSSIFKLFNLFSIDFLFLIQAKSLKKVLNVTFLENFLYNFYKRKVHIEK